MALSLHAEERAALRLTAAPVAIRGAGFQPLSYRDIREAAINGVIPAHQRNNIWHFFDRDVGAIAKALNLPRLAKPARHPACAA